MRGFVDNDRLRRNVLLVMMGGTVVFGLFFIYHNLKRGLVSVALIEVVFVIFAAWMMPLTWRAQKLNRITRIFVLPWSVAMIAIVLIPGAALTVFIWPLLLPLVLHFLLGSRTGLLLSLAGYAAAALAAWRRFGLPDSPEEMVVAGNMGIAAVVSLLLAHVYERSREISEERLRDLATTDSLTGLGNRLRLDDAFDHLRARARREGMPLTALMLDLDHFKNVNDRHGHATGDRVLRALAELLRTRIRRSDLAFRLGGEEFLILLPDTRLDAARSLAEELRRSVEQHHVEVAGRPLQLSTSVGVAEMDPADGLDDLLAAADRRLYRAKELGRNRIIATG